MIEMLGKGVSEGVAIGPLKIYRKRVCDTLAFSGTPEEATSLFYAAREKTIKQLTELSQKAEDKTAALILETHAELADDLDFESCVLEKIQNDNIAPDLAVIEAGDEFALLFEDLGSEEMRARAVDIRDVAGRVAKNMAGKETEFQLDCPAVIFADELMPSETASLDRNKIIGFVLKKGSVNGHTTILANAMGIPAIINCDFDENQIKDGEIVIIDGTKGKILINPSDETLSKMKEKIGLAEDYENVKGLPAETKSGKKVKLCLNISSLEEIKSVDINEVDGVGLVRSEFLFMDRDNPPTEDEQFEYYKNLLLAFPGKDVVIRTADIGSDKKVSYLGQKEEDNPQLGLRGIRLCLKYPEFFKTQLRALLRASCFGKLSIMFPMISSLNEVKEAKRLCHEALNEVMAAGTRLFGKVQIGIMIETPAAAIISDELAKEVDFFSFGTNDLTQYTLAADRSSGDLDDFYDPHHEAVFRLLEMATKNAHKEGIWVGVCGELGSDSKVTERLVKIGIDELSVSPPKVLKIKKTIREI